MQRRNLLKHAGVGLAGLTTGYGVVTLTTANAEAGLTVSGFSIKNASATTDDGTISGVNCDVSGSWSYDLPAGSNNHRWQLSIEVLRNDQAAQIASTNGEAKYLRASGDYSLSGSITDTTLFDASDFTAKDNGQTKTVDVTIRLMFTVTNPDGKVLASAELQDTATVSVTNKEYQPSEYGDASGSGSLTIKK